MTNKNLPRIYSKIYDIVKQIPRGEVRTYSQIAKLAGTHPRVVGNALHKNPDPSSIPCHRVVSKSGGLAPNFAFGGIDGQAKRLQHEGITVGNNRVSLDLNSK